jgi:hypothetical protein
MGIFTAVTVATVSIPLIFEINTVLWFNELYVTSGTMRLRALIIFAPFLFLLRHRK